MSTSALAGQRPYHHGNLRSALLAEAVRVLAEGDSASLSLRELARRLGVSHAAPYRHFADKDALLAALAQQGFEQLAADLEAAAARHPQQPLRQMADTGWAYVHFALRQPQHFQVMFGRGPTTVEPTAYPELLAAGQHAFGVLLRIVESGQRAAALAEGQPRELAVTAWSQVHGLATLLLEGQVPTSSVAEAEALVRRCIDLQLAGLASGSGAASGFVLPS